MLYAELPNGVTALCASRKYPHPPHGRSLEIPRGRRGGGPSPAKIYKGKYEAKLEIPGGGRVQTKNLPWGGMDIFWKHTLCSYNGEVTVTLSSQYLSEGGVWVCGDAVLGYFWCGFVIIFILRCGIAVLQH